MIFTDDPTKRLIMSEEFNFALDKESNVSVCWGKDINDTPEYDPISPQELIFKINSFNLSTYLKNFNFLANIKVKVGETEFKNIENELTALSMDNLSCLSTLSSVVLIFDEKLNTFNIDELLQFTKYIKKFGIALIIQINMSNELKYGDIVKLKLLGTSIQIKTDDNFNGELFLKNIKLLKDNGILVSSKVSINKDSYDEIFNIINKLDKDTSMKIFFTVPYITTNNYIKIQNEFIKAQLNNVKIATCAHNKFNKRKANIFMSPCDCDAARFSIYIEDNVIYPCEYSKFHGINIDACKSITDFWFDKDMKKMREYIADNNFCKLISK